MKETITIYNATQAEIEAAEERRSNRLKARKCEKCGQLFKPKREWQKFCSTAHKVRYHQLKREIIAQKKKEAENAQL